MLTTRLPKPLHVMSTLLYFITRYNFNVSKCDPDSVRTTNTYILEGCLFQHYTVHGVGMCVELTPAKCSVLSSYLPPHNQSTDKVRTVVTSGLVIGKNNS
jgi:hypothetical protein